MVSLSIAQQIPQRNLPGNLLKPQRDSQKVENAGGFMSFFIRKIKSLECE
jgi:hypothetical protein